VNAGAVISSDGLVALGEELARVASAGGGVNALATRVAALCNVAVLVEDGEWRHVTLAGTARHAAPPSAREFVRAASEGDVVRLRTPAGDVAGIAIRLRAGETTAGWASFFAPQAPGVLDAAALRLAAATIGVELARDAGARRLRRASFWDRLLAREFDDPIEARDEAATRGIVLASAYVAVAVEAEGLDEATAAAQAAELRRIVAAAVRSSAKDVVALERGDGFVFLCPTPLDVDAANVRTAATLIPRVAARAGFRPPVVGGVGRAAETIAAHRTVDEAREAMFVARRLFGGARVIPYDDLGVYPMLLRGGTTQGELHAFSERVLAPLRAYDEKHQSELVRTLRLFFDLGQNVKRTAAALSVHRHTVFYRLRQIADVGGCDLGSPHDQLTLRTAMAIDALNTNER